MGTGRPPSIHTSKSSRPRPGTRRPFRSRTWTSKISSLTSTFSTRPEGSGAGGSSPKDPDGTAMARVASSAGTRRSVFMQVPPCFRKCTPHWGPVRAAIFNLALHDRRGGLWAASCQGYHGRYAAVFRPPSPARGRHRAHAGPAALLHLDLAGELPGQLPRVRGALRRHRRL